MYYATRTPSQIWIISRSKCRRHWSESPPPFSLKTFSFNNRVLRLPAIVLLNTTFRPGNSGLLRVCPSFLNTPIFTYTRRRPEFPGRNVVFNKTIAGRVFCWKTKNPVVECIKASENVCENLFLLWMPFPLFFPFRLMLNKSFLRISMAKKKKN